MFARVISLYAFLSLNVHIELASCTVAKVCEEILQKRNNLEKKVNDDSCNNGEITVDLLCLSLVYSKNKLAVLVQSNPPLYIHVDSCFLSPYFNTGRKSTKELKNTLKLT